MEELEDMSSDSSDERAARVTVIRPETESDYGNEHDYDSEEDSHVHFSIN